MCVRVFVPVYVCMCVQIKQRMDEEEYSAFLLHLFVCTRVCMFKTVVFIPVGVHIHTYFPVYACIHAHSKKHLHSETSTRDPSHKPRLACNSATLPSSPYSTRVSSGKAHRRNQLPERPPNTRRDCRRKPHFRLPWRPESGLRERSVRLNH